MTPYEKEWRQLEMFSPEDTYRESSRLHLEALRAIKAERDKALQELYNTRVLLRAALKASGDDTRG